MFDALSARLKSAGIDLPVEELLARPGESIPGLRPHADDALLLWERLRDLVPDTGHWPVLLAAPLEQVREDFEADPRPLSELLQAADRVGPDPRQWLLATGADAEDIEADLADLHGDWPQNAEPATELELDVETTAVIALIPSARGCEAPAHLRFGGWEPCWPPENHLALLRAWETAYGAELVAIGGGELILRVTKPPQGKEAALALAETQALYAGAPCGYDTVEELAAHRMVDEVWSFLWE